MKPLSIDRVSVEITRECNMACLHCMRGDAQKKTLDLTAWENMCESVNEIDSINLTGGEPSLRPDIMMAMLDIAKKHDVEIRSCYVVTNAKEISKDFIIALAAWFEYTHSCDDDTASELNGICVSHDCYHENIPAENINKLKIFRAFNAEAHNRGDRHDITVQAKGRALEYVNPQYLIRPQRCTPIVSESENETYIYDESVTLTVDGDILTDCDYAYDDIDDIYVANVLKDKDWVDKLKKACQPE